MRTFAPLNISRYTSSDPRASSVLNFDSNTNRSYYFESGVYFAYRLQPCCSALRARIRYTQYASSASAAVSLVGNAIRS